MRWHAFRENLIGYSMVFPALAIIFLFGIFPIGFAFFVSLHRWRRFPGEYIGIDNYVRALGDFSYVLFFWFALGALAGALLLANRFFRMRSERLNGLLSLFPGTANAAAVTLLIFWVARVLPVILDIPQRIRGQERVTGVFIAELLASFQLPDVTSFFVVVLITSAIAVTTSVLFIHFSKKRVSALNALWRATWLCLALVTGTLLLNFTLEEMLAAILAARDASQELPLGIQVVFMTLGAVLLLAAYRLWTSANRQHSDQSFFWRVSASACLIVAGYILFTQLPQLLTNADRSMARGLGVTVMFALGTIPPQLAIGIVLAYLLFQNVRGKAFFRMVYFLPYVMPFAATSLVFSLLFSHRPESPINRLLQAVGIPVQRWLLEPTGIFELLFGAQGLLAGPSLALVVIIIYTAWIYIGYATVVFLAGLGNIPAELSEAARIDGASEWGIFRHITLPLLSPTTFFLTLIAVIGTFQSFTQIWIMRTAGAADSVDTLGVYIFRTIRSTDPNMGYGSALSLVLFLIIIVLTLFQNRIFERRVFYLG
ncbi:MAG: ABC transporter permease subunit [Aggregatilineales bacterium]